MRRSLGTAALLHVDFHIRIQANPFIAASRHFNPVLLCAVHMCSQSLASKGQSQEYNPGLNQAEPGVSNLQYVG